MDRFVDPAHRIDEIVVDVVVDGFASGVGVSEVREGREQGCSEEDYLFFVFHF
jgi:hypothetical protein